MKWSAVALAVVIIPAIAVGVMFLLGPYGGESVVLKAGDAAEEGDLNLVQDLSVSAEDWRLVAQKWSESSKDFQISFFRRGANEPEICHSGAKFSAILSRMSVLRVVKVLSESETGQLLEDNFGKRIQVDLLYSGRVIYSSWDIFRQKGDHSKLLLVSKDFPKTAFEPTWNASLFDNLSKGCGYLGGETPR